MWHYRYNIDSRDHQGSVLMTVYFSVHISLPLPSSPRPFPPNTPYFSHTEWKGHWLQSIQEEKFKTKDFNLKVMKCLMKCRFLVIAIPGTYKAVLIFLILFWYSRKKQHPHPMVLNTLQQVEHREKSPDWRSYSQIGSQQSLWIRGRTIISFFEIQKVRHRKRKCLAQ